MYTHTHTHNTYIVLSFQPSDTPKPLESQERQRGKLRWGNLSWKLVSKLRFPPAFWNMSFPIRNTRLGHMLTWIETGLGPWPKRCSSPGLTALDFQGTMYSGTPNSRRRRELWARSVGTHAAHPLRTVGAIGKSMCQRVAESWSLERFTASSVQQVPHGLIRINNECGNHSGKHISVAKNKFHDCSQICFRFKPHASTCTISFKQKMAWYQKTIQFVFGSNNSSETNRFWLRINF